MGVWPGFHCGLAPDPGWPGIRPRVRKLVAGRRVECPLRCPDLDMPESRSTRHAFHIRGARTSQTPGGSCPFGSSPREGAHMPKFMDVHYRIPGLTKAAVA